MATVFPAFAPLGRLYDPLLELAARVQDGLSRRRQTVWIDSRGCVFLSDAEFLHSMSTASIIGTYDFRTPLSVIEGDLRLALRERASSWILDWDAKIPVPHASGIGMMPLRKSRKRVRSLADGLNRVPHLIA